MKPPQRALYRERQRLRAADLRAEQEYLLGLAGQHHIGPHRWGIVRGLSIVGKKDQEEAVVTPGYAIDGYGRELVVFEPVRISLQKSAKNYVYLYYCERAQGSCGDSPNSRWRDSAEISVSSEEWPMPPDELYLAEARAAGGLTDAPPWPVLLGIADPSKIGPDPEPSLSVDLSESTFTALRAGRVISPSRRAVMRIGQENLADPYHFRVTAQGMGNRFAISRDGDASLWGNLVLLGTTYSAKIETQRKGLSIKVSTKTVGDSDILWRAKPGIREGMPTMTLTFRREAASVQPIREEFVLDDKLGDALTKFNEKRASPVRLSLLIDGAQSSEAGKKTSEQPAATRNSDFAILDDREQPLVPRGAMLSFSREKAIAALEQCGCRDQLEEDAQLPGGFIFKPTSAAPRLPTSRDIYSLVVKDADQPSVEQVRISGGPLASGDFKRRITIGNSVDPKKFNAWLAVRGDGSIQLPGDKTEDKPGDKPYPMIQVTGTAEYPPVKPDPRDPLFNYLLTLAFVSGVLSVSSSLLKVTFSKLPDFIDLAQPTWQYELSLQNLALTEPLLAKSHVERISSGQQSLLNTKLTLPQKIDPKQSSLVTISHTPQDVPKGDEVTIEISVVMLAGSIAIGSSAASKKIPVLQGPLIDLTSVPDSVPPDTAWVFTVKITNQSARKLTVSGIQVVGAGGTTQSVPPPPPPPIEIGPPLVSTPAPQSAQPEGAHFTIQATIAYKWENTTTTLSLTTAPVDVVVEKHLTLIAKKNGAGKYKLTLTNKSDQSLTLKALHARIYPETDARPASADLDVTGLNENMDHNDVHTETVIAATPAGIRMKVDVDVEYERVGRLWSINDSSGRMKIP